MLISRLIKNKFNYFILYNYLKKSSSDPRGNNYQLSRFKISDNYV